MALPTALTPEPAVNRVYEHEDGGPVRDEGVSPQRVGAAASCSALVTHAGG